MRPRVRRNPPQGCIGSIRGFKKRRGLGETADGCLRFFGERGKDDFIAFAQEITENAVRNIRMEINADPVLLVHVPTWPDPLVLQRKGLHFRRVALEIAELRRKRIVETKPLPPHTRAHDLSRADIRDPGERHILRYPPQRTAKSSQFRDIHKRRNRPMLPPPSQEHKIFPLSRDSVGLFQIC